MRALAVLLVMAAATAAVAGHQAGPWWAVLALGVGVWIGTLAVARGLVWLLALLPLSSFTAWTGSFLVEEFDCLVLGACALWLMRARARARPGVAWVPVVWGVCVAIAAARGVWRMDGASLVHFDSAWNAVRHAKAFLAAGLCAWVVGRAVPPGQLWPAVLRGNVWGLLLVSLVCLWERAAFPGLGNFSTDYRITGPFWEMHVGGAALDGYLMLTLPAAAWCLFHARARVVAVSALAILLGSHAVFASFSRALQVGYACVVSVLAWWQARHAARLTALQWLLVLASVGAAGVLLVAVFASGGYRALAAVGSVVVLCAVLGSRTWPHLHAWPAALHVAVPALGASGVVSLLHIKGAYLAWGVSSAAAVVSVAVPRCQGWAWVMAPVVAVNAVWVAAAWGGPQAVGPAALAVVSALMVAVVSTSRPVPLWRGSLRAGLALVWGLVLLSGVAVVAHSAFMGERVSQVSRDLDHRVAHWSRAAALWSQASFSDQWWGLGLGRFAALAGAHDSALPGQPTHQFLRDESGPFLRLIGPAPQPPGTDVLRVSQSRAGWPAAPVLVSFAWRGYGPGALVVGLCYKHLLYATSCEHVRFALEDSGGEWRTVTRVVDLSRLNVGPWWAPRDAMFTLAQTHGAVDLANLSVAGAGGELLANGDFSAGAGRWFFTSDHHHLPWHVKQLWLAVLIEQGVLGVIAWSALMLWAAGHFWRGGSVGVFMLAGGVGFAVVGLFDTLLDVPRLAFLFTLLALLSPAAADADG